ncbi:MAG: thioredoxin family protein [Erysipelotrichaceae bacterium]|nr:thioredoxin family protein [Erysipelotrichaceae bacterium]
MMDEGKTFIVYFGANWCPWCRSILPTFIELARKNNVRTVYYVDVRPNNDHEREIRNVYAVNENGEVYRSHEGTAAYNEFIARAKDVLADYTRSDVESLDGTKWEGEKRVGAPNFVLVVKGEPVQMITGVSLLQTDPYMELTEELLADVADILQRFMNDYKENR